MATTRWDDPANWTTTDWADATRQPLISHLWDEIKGACDERVAYSENAHDSSFPASLTCPDWNTDKAAILMGAETPKNAVRIENAVYPSGCVETDTISTSGTVSASDIPENLTLSELLTGPLGYASGNLLHATDTDDGNDNAIFRMAWFKQWYEVLDYPEYYNRLIRTTGTNEGPEVTDVQWQFVEADLLYAYNIDTSTFTNATMEVWSPQPTSTPTDVYVANDLNETAPFSTVTQCRDYCITSFDDEVANDNWQGIGVGDVSDKEIYASMRYSVLRGEIAGGVAGQVEISIILRHQRIRFKVSDAYRAVSPGRYTVPVKWNGYYRDDTSGYTCPTSGPLTITCTDQFDNFGTGETKDEIVFVTLTADGSDYFYLEIDPDFTNPAVPSLPANNVGTVDRYTCYRYSLTPTMNTITSVLHSIYLNPNTTDGNNFYWYTPAP